MTTQTIPTDRHGNPYYGPTTWAEACDLIRERDEAAGDDEPSCAGEVADSLESAGYHRIALRVRTYGVRK